MATNEGAQGLLLDLGDLATRRTRAELIEHALRTALIVTEADAAVFLSPSARRGERLVLHAGSAAPSVVPASPSGSEVFRLFARECRLLALPDISYQPGCAEGDGCPGVEAGPVLFAPLRQRDPAPGYLAVFRRTARARFGLAEGRTMLLLSAWLALALEGLRLASGRQQIAVTDDLTEVYNERFLKTALRRELRRAARFGQELSLVLVEPDRLDALREERGELGAGTVLREMASLLARHLRAFDLVARSGKDRFMLVLPQTGRDGAQDVAERLRTAVERGEFSAAPAFTITASFGVASFPREGGDVKELLATVERALEQALQRGSNRVSTLDRAA